ncbi:MAG: ribonuclease T [Novosphingobium sp.]
MSRALIGLAAAIACAAPVAAMAQAALCMLPAQIDPLPPIRAESARRIVPVGGYTLAASWSPEFCFSHRDDQSSAMQCSGRMGRFGFVLHGLWPEAANGPPPEWCAAGGIAPPPSPQALRPHLCMTPSARLLGHEWARHGTCMAPSPEAYFRTEAGLWGALRWPDTAGMARRRGLTAGDLKAAFLRVNPAWRAGQVAVMVSPKGWLTAIQLCYGRDLHPAACPAQRRGASDDAAMKVAGFR